MKNINWGSPEKFTTSHPLGGIFVEEWKCGGHLHRIDGPARISYYETGEKWTESWHHEGELHREDGPASVWYQKNGAVESFIWRRHGVPHRSGGPCEASFHKNGSLQYSAWYVDGNIDSSTMPNRVWYHENGVVSQELYSVGPYGCSILHRLDGPAYIKYSNTGRIEFREWHLGGNPFYTEEDFQEDLIRHVMAS